MTLMKVKAIITGNDGDKYYILQIGEVAPDPDGSDRNERVKSLDCKGSLQLPDPGTTWHQTLTHTPSVNRLEGTLYPTL
jgi:hypothetical protein